MMMTEMDFKILDKYPGYRIYADGRIYSLRRKKYLPGSKTKRGYLAYTLIDVEGRRKFKNKHVLLAEAFIPNPNNLPEVRHLDDDKSNLTLSNLKWGTHKENAADAVKNGLMVMPQNAKTWLIKSPNGGIMTTDNLTLFCKEYGLTKSLLHKTYKNGSRERRAHHKHYTIIEML